MTNTEIKNKSYLSATSIYLKQSLPYEHFKKLSNEELKTLAWEPFEDFEAFQLAYDIETSAHAIYLTFIEPKKEKFKTEYVLSLYMDTDDDAEVLYLGESFCLYSDPLDISKSFDSREEAISHLYHTLRVAYGGKADSNTFNWIKESLQALKREERPESYGGNQQYRMSITEQLR